MTDALEQRRRAAEEQFFEQQNKEALKRLKERSEARKSPITGKPMKQKTLMGVTIDYCEDSKGIWLDAGELEQIIEASKKDSSFFGNLFSGLFGK
jgi:hypothetical protein